MENANTSTAAKGILYYFSSVSNLLGIFQLHDQIILCLMLALSSLLGGYISTGVTSSCIIHVHREEPSQYRHRLVV